MSMCDGDGIEMIRTENGPDIVACLGCRKCNKKHMIEQKSLYDQMATDDLEN